MSSIALSIRREVWENRSIYIAPLIVAGVIVFGALVATLIGTHGLGVKLSSNPDKIVEPYNIAALMLMGTTFIVAIFYCLDALYGERRDRSILFWKSMPVSDWTTVLSKAAVPIVILPLLTFAITIATQLVALLLSTAFLLAHGASPALLWTQVPWPRMSGMLLYHLLFVHGLYYAPIFAWLLLVSAWAKRLPFLWASVPIAAVAILEKVAFNTSRFGALLGSRIAGGENPMPQQGGVMMLGHFDPLQFFGSPGLWIGLVLTALFLFGAVQLRRYRDPI